MSVQTLNIPQGVPSDGTVRVDFVPSGGLADYKKPKTAEVRAASAENLSCHLFAIGEAATEERKEKRRLCSKQKYELLGSTSYTIDDLSYVYDVQNPLSDTNSAYAVLVPRTTGHLIIRWGIDSSVGPVRGQIVDVYPVRLGAQRKQAPEENDELTVLQSVVVTGDKVTDVALVASVPAVTGATPSGATAGTTVKITGFDFTGATAVTFGGTAATSFTVVDDSTINAVMPAGTAGSAPIVVTTPAGASAPFAYTRG